MRETSQEIRAMLVEALADVQTCCGRPMCEVTDNTIPMEHLAGFKSLNAVEVANKLSSKLGFKVRPNILLQKYQGQYPTIGQIVRRLSPADGSHRGDHHE